MTKISPLTLKELYFHRKLRPLPGFLNLWSIEEDALIGVDLQMTFLFEIFPTDLLHKAEPEVDFFFSGIRNLLHALPENMTVQFLVQGRSGDAPKLEEYQTNVSAQGDGVAPFIVDQKLEHFRTLLPYRKRYFMYLTTYPKETDLTKTGFSVFKVLNPDYNRITREIHQTRLQKLKEISEILSTQLKALGVEHRQLKKEEVLQVLYEYLNPSRSDYLSSTTFKPELTLRSQIVFNACKNEFDHIYIDGYYYRAVNLHTRPGDLVYLDIIDLLRSTTPDYDLVLSVHSVNQDKAVKDLQFTATTSTVIANINPFSKYHEAEIKAEHAKGLVEWTKTNFQKLYQVSFCVILKDTNLETLTTRTNNLVQAFRSLGEAEGIIDDGNHLYLYLSALPGHSQLNFRKHIFHSDAVAQFFPFHRTWTGSREAKILFLTREHELLPLDLFDPELPAKHGLVLGTTGSGKSFTTNFLLTNFYIESEKNHIIIIDVGGSYRKISRLLRGEYLEIELSEDFAFNPFPSKLIAVTNQEENNFEVDPDILAYLTLLLQKMVSNKPQFEAKELKILENAIINTYRFSKHDPPILSACHYQLLHYEGDEEDKAAARDFSKNLDMYTSGRFGKLLNRPESIHPQGRFIVFDLQKLQEQPQLQTIIFFLIRSVIEGKLRDKSLKKMIVIDEGWKFFNDEVGAELIQNLYRTARKFNAMVLSISQSPEDFLKSTAANAIISNSFIKYILRLQKGHDLLNQFELNPQEIEDVRSLQSVRRKYSEVFLKFNNRCQVIRIQPSPCDYWICTTDPDDYQLEMQIRKDNPDLNETEILKKLIAREVERNV